MAGLLMTGVMLMLNGCDDASSPEPNNLINTPFYALNDANQLLRIKAGESYTPLATTKITGTDIQLGERIMSIDFRPATGQLYGVSSLSRLFIINPETAKATPVTVKPFLSGSIGTIVGIDFNPATDQIRLVSSEGHNVSIQPETGQILAVNGQPNSRLNALISEVAYTNNRAVAAGTTLYDIDPATDRLYIHHPQKNTLTDVGGLGLDIAGAAGFDITPDGRGVVALTFNGNSELAVINLTTGRLQKVGNLPGTVIGLAIPTEPVAYAIDATNNLLILNPAKPVPIAKSVTGLQPDEVINGLDFRPATGQLYALGSTNRLYTLNLSDAAATRVGEKAFAKRLAGTVVSFAFDAALDRVQLTTNTGSQLKLNPKTGEIALADESPAMQTVFRKLAAYRVQRVNDSTRIYDTNPVSTASLTGVLIPGNPVIRAFAAGPGF